MPDVIFPFHLSTIKFVYRIEGRCTDLMSEGKSLFRLHEKYGPFCQGSKVKDNFYKLFVVYIFGNHVMKNFFQTFWKDIE